MKSMKRNCVIISVLILLVVGIILSGILFAYLIRSDPYYKSAKLIKAIMNNDYDMLEVMLRDGTDPNVPEFKETFITRMCEVAPETALGIAAKHDDLEAVRILLQYGASPNPNDILHSCPLIDTISTNGSNSFEIVKLLIQYGADPYKTDGTALNAYYKVLERYSPELSEESMRLTQIMDYMLGYFDETPQTVREKCSSNWSLATTAIYVGENPSLIRFLLQKGDTVNVDSVYKGYKGGISFYDWCYLEEHKTILVILQEYGYLNS